MLCRLLALSLLTGLTVQAQSLEWVGDGALVEAVSADGSVAMGRLTSPAQAFRWTAAGLELLGNPPGAFTSRALDASADGSVLVGAAQLTATGGSDAFRWTEGDYQLLGLPNGTASSISADGTVAAGQALFDGRGRATRWVGETAASLGTLGGDFSSATDLSADGSVVVGGAFDITGTLRPFRWENGTMIDLGTLGGTGLARAYAVSSDGRVVVGSAPDASERVRAFRWEAGSMVDLGPAPGYPDGEYLAVDVSADGSVVAGSYGGADGVERAIVWQQSVGWRPLRDLLTDAGLDVSGWTFAGITGISDDGLVFGGQGRNPSGVFGGWVASLRPSTPAEPAPARASPRLTVGPNPMTTAGTVRLTVPQAGPVQVRVVDLLGRTVSVVLDGAVAAGDHALSLHTSGLAQGVYLIRVESPGGVLVRPFVLAR